MRRFLTGSVAVLALAIRAHATNLVFDPGFESANLGTFSTDLGDGAWYVSQGNIQVLDAADSDGAVPHSGSQFIYLGYGFLQNTISQTLSTVVGQSYIVSFWAADNDPNSLIVNFGDQNLFTGMSPTGGIGAAGDYVNFMYTVTADSTFTDLTFTGQWLGIGDGDYGTILDDVSVTASGVPEPASLGATGLGLLMLWFLLRRPLKTPAPRG